MSKLRDYNVVFRENKTIVETVDSIAEESGKNRSTFIREAIRAKLKAEADSAK